MSMQHYASYGTGLVITDKELTELTPSLTGKLGLAEDSSYYEIAEALQEHNYAEYTDYTESSGIEVSYLDGRREYPEEVLIIYSARQPQLFEKAYKDEREMVEEFKNKYDKYLPEDFNYFTHLAWFEC